MAKIAADKGSKITPENRELFLTKSKIHKDEINKIFANEKAVLLSISKNPSGVARKKLALSKDMIYAATLYIGINDISVEILGTKNNDALNEARKILYKAIIYLENIVTPYVDIQYSEIEEQLSEIANFTLEERYYLVRKLGLSIKLLIDAFGDNTKWKWSFVEIQGRFTTVMKNLLDWKQASKDYFDSGSSNYDITVFYIRLVKKYLEISAKEYRDRYELSTHRIDDMRLATNYLEASRRLAIIIDEHEDAEEFKKKAQIWRDKLESDQKKGIAS